MNKRNRSSTPRVKWSVLSTASTAQVDPSSGDGSAHLGDCAIGRCCVKLFSTRTCGAQETPRRRSPCHVKRSIRRDTISITMRASRGLHTSHSSRAHLRHTCYASQCRTPCVRQRHGLCVDSRRGSCVAYTVWGRAKQPTCVHLGKLAAMALVCYGEEGPLGG